MDAEKWNPATDQHLPAEARYSFATVTGGKAAAKARFQEQHGLRLAAGVPLVGMVGRLTPQKGTDVLLAALPTLLSCTLSEPAHLCNCSSLEHGHRSSLLNSCAQPLQIAVLGSGEHCCTVRAAVIAAAKIAAAAADL